MAEHIARKRFGQHFLRDADILADMVRAIGPRPDDRMVEIGPGLGALTVPLLGRVDHLQAIELDRDLIARLMQRFPTDRLTVHAADVLDFDFSVLGDRLRIVGNLPYNISTPLLFHLARHAPAIHDIHVMLQKEVVDRMAAAAGEPARGKLSVMLQSHFDIEPLFEVPPQAFDPPPKVQSAVVRLVPLRTGTVQASDPAWFERIVTQAFSQRRKTLRNSLAPLFSETELAAFDIDARRRAETLTLEEFLRIANHPARKDKP